MERRFSMNDFEQSLKEHADEFKMIPSKRVWHGIYNDMHPGRRWPSVTMSLLLIFTLVVVGHLNTHNGYKPFNSTNISLQSKNAARNLKPVEISKKAKEIALQKSVPTNVTIAKSAKSQFENIESKPEVDINSNYSTENIIADDLLAQSTFLNHQSGSEIKENNKENDIPETNIIIRSQGISGVKSNDVIKEQIIVNNSNNLQSDQQITIKNINLKYTTIVSDNNSNNVVKNDLSETDKKPNKLKQKNNKISWVYFLAPQVNSVVFGGESVHPDVINPSVIAINRNNNKVLHNPAPGFESGVQVNYLLAKKLSFSSGLHITYSGYNIISNEVHPTFANLFLKDPVTGDVYSKSYITHYGNGTGQTEILLRNYNLQASIPIGFQYEFSGNNKIQFNVAADYEPSMIIKSNAYILSSDGNNYINDPDLLRKINMSSNFGLFATFSSAKFKWQIGPNVRYQWLSTYKTDYTVKEHLINYGIRIGISPLRK